ncbi:MAG: hypothetical protein QFB87_00695 [Patescibacteria group bacterium]|nr:hypothetical protein [Patescibacteria group bacterium]
MNALLARLATAIDVNSLPGSTPGSSLTDTPEIKTILGIVFGVVGALSILVITISGFRYVLSAGDPKRTAQAKDGIIYALVGLAVAIMAETIVAFVIGKIG